jgi:hypothetical protein
MAFCRLDGSRTKEAEERVPERRRRHRRRCTASENSQILKRPRERVAELLPGSMYRRRYFFAGYERPREECESSAREKRKSERKIERSREREREREKARGKESPPRCFSCSPIRYINIPNRDSRRYTVRRAREDESRSSLETRFRAARFRKFNQATPPRFVLDEIILLTITGTRIRQRIDRSPARMIYVTLRIFLYDLRKPFRASFEFPYVF